MSRQRAGSIRAFTPEDSDEFFRLYESGLNLDQIADIMLISRSSVYKALKLRGMRLRPKGWREGRTVFDVERFR